MSYTHIHLYIYIYTSNICGDPGAWPMLAMAMPGMQWVVEGMEASWPEIDGDPTANKHAGSLGEAPWIPWI
jgi:hypothetical protein